MILPINDVASAAMNGVELVATWLTPTVLFCILNLMIGTIFITSSLNPHKKQQNDVGENNDEHPPQLARVPSFFQRVKSINLSRHQPPQPDPAQYAIPAQEHAQQNLGGDKDEQTPQLARVPSFFERVKSINLSRHQPQQPDPAHYAVPAQDDAAREQEPDYECEEPHQVTRSKSGTETKTASAARMLKKSASEKVLAGKREEVDERRPATVREKTAAGEDEAVDAKADDFINRFRQQLKLQRLDSILRYKEMLNRGAAR